MTTVQHIQPAGEIEQGAISAILSIVHARTGVDFSTYRESTLHRRILNRMLSIGLDSIERYLEVLSANHHEPQRLLERVTIKVSRFYRNKVTFDYLRKQVIPALVSARAGEPLKVWCAGCGCGEEAYTLAMLLDEAGATATIEATDIDATALASARLGVYPAAALTELPADLARKYLEPVRDGFTDKYLVRDILRRRVRFSESDLTAPTANAGKGGFDIVSCRNVLIYLRREIQDRIMRSLRQSVKEGGVLCLGEAEWPPAFVLSTLQCLGRNTRLFRATGAPPA